MKHKFVKIIFCSLLISALMLMPLSALAASKVYVVKVVSDGGEGVHLRSSTNPRYPNPSANNVIARLHNGDKLLYFGNVGGMAKVVDVKGRWGYIWRKCIAGYGVVRSDQVYKTVQGAVVYDSSGRRICTTGANVPVCIQGTKGDMVQVRNLNGKIGYMYMSDLKKV